MIPNVGAVLKVDTSVRTEVVVVPTQFRLVLENDRGSNWVLDGLVGEEGRPDRDNLFLPSNPT
jgi:hypothetical protein